MKEREENFQGEGNTDLELDVVTQIQIHGCIGKKIKSCTVTVCAFYTTELYLNFFPMVMRNTGCHRDLLRQVAERGAPGPSGKHPHIQGSFPLKQWRIPALDKYYVQVLNLFTISINSIWILGPLGFVLDFATKYSWPLLNILNKSIYQILEESKG